MKNLSFVILVTLVINVLPIAGSEYVAFVREGKVFHLIDNNGNILSKEPMTKVMPFFNGYSSCIIDKKWNYIDQNGNTFTYEGDVSKLHAFKDGVGAFMSNKKWGFLNNQGEVVIEPEFSDVKMFTDDKCWVKSDEKWYLIDKQGNEVFNAKFDKFHYYKEGLARVKNEGLWGYVNETGELLGDGLIYSDAHDFVSGVAFVKKEDLWGIMDNTGVWVLDPRYVKVWGDFSEGMARVKQGEYIGVVNKDGEEILAPVFKKVTEYKNGFCAAFKDNTWRVFDTEGAVIADGFYKVEPFQEGYAVIEKNEQIGLISETGEVKILGKYDRIKPFVNGYALVKKGDHWGYINAKLEEVIEPQYMTVKNFETDWATVKTTDERWTFINQAGEIVFETNFEKAFPFVRNMQADKDYGCNQTSYVNTSLSSLISKTKMWFVKSDMVETTLARVKHDGAWAFINKEGEFVLKDLDNAEAWINGFARFRDNDKWGIVDQNGVIVIEAKYDRITDFYMICK